MPGVLLASTKSGLVGSLLLHSLRLSVVHTTAVHITYLFFEDSIPVMDGDPAHSPPGDQKSGRRQGNLSSPFTEKSLGT